MKNNNTRKHKLNTPKLFLFILVNVTFVVYCVVLLPWIWENLTQPMWTALIILGLACFVLWVPILNSIIMSFYFVPLIFPESLTMQVTFAMPAVMIILVLAKFGERFIVPCRSDTTD